MAEQMISETDPQNWVRIDAAFHAAIVRANGNQVFVDLLATIGTALARRSVTLNLVVPPP